jgi:hypothetical protein
MALLHGQLGSRQPRWCDAADGGVSSSTAACDPDVMSARQGNSSLGVPSKDEQALSLPVEEEFDHFCARAAGEHVVEFLERGSNNLRARRFRVARFTQKVHEGVDQSASAGSKLMDRISSAERRDPPACDAIMLYFVPPQAFFSDDGAKQPQLSAVLLSTIGLRGQRFQI